MITAHTQMKIRDDSRRWPREVMLSDASRCTPNLSTQHETQKSESLDLSENPA